MEELKSIAGLTEIEQQALLIVAGIMDRAESDPGHCWIMFDSNDQYYVGCDDLAERLRLLAQPVPVVFENRR